MVKKCITVISEVQSFWLPSPLSHSVLFVLSYCFFFTLPCVHSFISRVIFFSHLEIKLLLQKEEKKLF